MNLPFTAFLQALSAGLACGFIVSIPVGPVNLTVINQALRRGFLAAFLAGLGAVCAEVIYASIMLAGHVTLLEHPGVAQALRAVALVAITFVAVKSLFFQPAALPLSAEKAERFELRWHYPRAFLLGFLLTISNLLLLVVWATLTAMLFAHEWVRPSLASRLTCLVGIFLGATTWFFLLAYGVARAHRRVSPLMLTWLVRGCGAVFLIFAGLLAYKLF